MVATVFQKRNLFRFLNSSKGLSGLSKNPNAPAVSRGVVYKNSRSARALFNDKLINVVIALTLKPAKLTILLSKNILVAEFT